MGRYLICGYYGYGNAGDEAILQAVCTRIGEMDGGAKICVLSASPRTTAAAFGVRSISRFSVRAFCRELRCADVFVLGGGGLLQDATSSRSLLYYLATLVIAQLMGVRTMLLGNSIGPLNGRLNRRMTRRVLSGVDYITVRDSRSYQLLKDIGVNAAHCELLADPVLMLPPVRQEVRAGSIAVALRDWQSETDFFAEIEAGLRELIALGYTVRIIPFHYEHDFAISQRMATALGRGAECMTAVPSITDLLNALAESEVVIAMRLHALILAALVGTPMVGISYDPKVAGFLQSIEQDLAGCVESIRASAIVDATLQAIQRKDAVRAALERHRERFVALAQRNMDIAVDLAAGRSPAPLDVTRDSR